MTVGKKKQGPYVRGRGRGTYFRWGGGVRLLLRRDINKEHDVCMCVCWGAGDGPEGRGDVKAGRSEKRASYRK